MVPVFSCNLFSQYPILLYFQEAQNQYNVLQLLTHLLNNVTSDVHLGIADIRRDHTEEILTPEELDEYRAFNNELRRSEYVSTRLLIKKLGNHAGLDSGIIKTRKDALGKPFCRYRGDHLYMSIAHSGDKVICALSEHLDIGIDIEPAEREVNPRLRERILNPAEVKELGDVEAIRLWTIKEAAVKLYGGGLRMNLNKLNVNRDNEGGFLARFNDEKTVRICSFQYKGYWISVALYT